MSSPVGYPQGNSLKMFTDERYGAGDAPVGVAGDKRVPIYATPSSGGVGFQGVNNIVPIAANRGGVSVPASALAQGYRALIFGSSSTQRCTAATNGFTTIPAISYYGWLNAFAGARFNLVKNAGVYGDTIAMCAARVAVDVLPNPADLIVWQVSANGAYGANTVESEVSAARQILTALVSTGARLAVLLPHYWSSAAGNAAGREKLHQIITQIKRMCYLIPGVIVVSSDQYINDTATVEPIAGLLEDGIHTTSAGAQLLGKALADALSPFFPASPWEHNTAAAIYNPADATTAARSIRNANPFFQGSGGAAAGTGISGTIAASIELSHYTTGGTVAASLVASPRGVGNAQRMIIAGATQDDRYTITQYVIGGSNPGAEAAMPLEGYYRGYCRARVTSQTAMRNIGLSVSQVSVGQPSSEITALWRTNTAANVRDKSFALASFDIDLATEIFRPADFYVAGNRTGVSTAFTCAFDGSGSATVDVYDMQLQRIG